MFKLVNPIQNTLFFLGISLFLLTFFFFDAGCAKNGSKNPNGQPSLPGQVSSSAQPSVVKSPFRPVWTNYQINAGVHAIAFEENYIWVGTDAGLIVYDKREEKIVKKIDNKTGLVSNDVTSIDVDAKGNKWIGTHGGGLVVIGKGITSGIKKVYNRPQLADPFVYKTLFDSKGRLWVATWKGANLYDGVKWRKFTKEDGLADNWVYSLGIDPEGTVWFGTEGGANSFDGVNWKTYTHKDGLGAELKDIPDYEIIVNKGKHHASSPGKKAEGYNPNYILSLAIDRSGVKWFGTWGAGLSRFDGKSWKTFTTGSGLPGNFVADIFIDSDNGVWIGTEGGIGFYDGKEWKKYTRNEGVIDDSVFTISHDAYGSKWFGTMEGISKLEGFAPNL